MIDAVAPFCINAFLYITTARLAQSYLAVSERVVWQFAIPTKVLGTWRSPGIYLPRLHRWFLWFDAIIVVIQASGACLWTPGWSYTAAGIGAQVSEAGLALQLVSLCVFSALLVKLHRPLGYIPETVSCHLRAVLYSTLAALNVRPSWLIFCPTQMLIKYYRLASFFELSDTQTFPSGKATTSHTESGLYIYSTRSPSWSHLFSSWSETRGALYLAHLSRRT